MSRNGQGDDDGVARGFLKYPSRAPESGNDDRDSRKNHRTI